MSVFPPQKNLNRKLYWTGYCSRPRNEAIYHIEEIIGKFGFIIDFKPFSDLSMGLYIETESKNCQPLFDALSQYISLTADEPSGNADADFSMILLNITFTKGTGNLRHEIPAVPG